ncbi:MAG: non-heme iron oxygenase ferredoxin subunit [Candidatus Nanopelagicales bacterium]|nr:non-heme iron oxygenase ferredoxin subunit [Candidatus Nanopelagicales bacterium]MCF8538740.1 non-heme iron oxygenase ferredoxin subunit [Candidatus Nanopelagicales bacterium]MCF8550806.1 non-heme iron oxygenase ferredoxin subunit [Candidatus Nanopelagicales bacterium]
MNQQVDLGLVQDIPRGTVKRFEVDGLALAVAHTDDGFFAVEDRCSHADVALSEGELDGCLLECWLHGSAFDVRTGEPQSLPALTPVRTFVVTADPLDPEGTISVVV